MRILNIENEMKKIVCKLILDCVQENVCELFKDYFENINHKRCIQNNNYTFKLPDMNEKIEQNCVAVAGGRIFNDMPLYARKIKSRIVLVRF